MKKFAVVAIFLTCVSLLLSTTQNRLLWGYWISRPSLVASLGEDVDLVGLSILQYKPELLILSQAEKKTTIDDAVNYHCQRKGHTCVGLKRLLFQLDAFYDDLSMMPDVEIEIAKNAYSEVLDSGWLPKIRNAKYQETGVPFYGLVIHFSTDVEEHILLAYHTHEISNDRFAYSEILFSKDDDDLSMQIQDRYFYEVSGLEGLEWPTLWPINFAILTIMYFSIVTYTKKRVRVKGKMQETGLGS